MHGRTRRHVTGSVRGPDRPYVHMPVKNFGREVHPGGHSAFIFTLMSSTVFRLSVLYEMSLRKLIFHHLTTRALEK